MVLLPMWKRVAVSLGKTLNATFPSWGQAVYPSWWPSLTKDMFTEKLCVNVVLEQDL